MIDFVQVGKKITACRKKDHLTQDELAAKLFVSRQLISKWELGIGVPTIDLLFELSKLFNISFEELLCLEDECVIDANDIFHGHDRLYIVNQVINNNIAVNLSDVFYQFSPIERMMILKEIKAGKTLANWQELRVKLTPSELKFMEMGLEKNDIKKSN